MSTDDFVSLDTARLLTLYAELAQRARLASPLLSLTQNLASKTPPKPEGPQNVAELRSIAESTKAIAKELQARQATQEITNLFFDDSPDVRMGAIMQFSEIDSELTLAATHALLAGLSTREALTLRLRARTPPPPQPSLKDMSDDALVARFEDVGLRESATSLLDPTEEPEDQQTQNRITGEVVDVLRELKARDLLGRLLPMLTNPNMTIRYRAAQGCQRLAEQAATAALESVAESLSFYDKVQALDILAYWRKGKALIDGL
jgi:hypothetical protein